MVEEATISVSAARRKGGQWAMLNDALVKMAKEQKIPVCLSCAKNDCEHNSVKGLDHYSKIMKFAGRVTACRNDKGQIISKIWDWFCTENDMHKFSQNILIENCSEYMRINKLGKINFSRDGNF